MNIVLENIIKSYGQDSMALRGISLEIKSGMFGLLGPNGAGKTTLMRIIATLIKPSKGIARVGGYRTDDFKEKWNIRAKLGYLPQDLSLYGDLSGREFLDFIAAMKGVHEQKRNQVKALLESAGLGAVSNKRIKTYSGGMKRRLGIAQALIGDPSLLIVDEPTVGLDPEERTKFRNMLVDLSSDRTVVLSTHIVEDVAQTCIKLAVLNQGVLIFNGNVADLITNAQDKVWEYIGQREIQSANVFTVAKARVDDLQMKYRVLAKEQPVSNAAQIHPNIEDGYLWLIKNNQLKVAENFSSRN